MSDTKLIDALSAAVLGSVTDVALLAECIRRGIQTPQVLTRETLTRRVEDLSADDLAYVLEHVDGAKLVYALDRGNAGRYAGRGDAQGICEGLGGKQCR